MPKLERIVEKVVILRTEIKNVQIDKTPGTARPGGSEEDFFGIRDKAKDNRIKNKKCKVYKEKNEKVITAFISILHSTFNFQLSTFNCSCRRHDDKHQSECSVHT